MFGTFKISIALVVLVFCFGGGSVELHERCMDHVRELMVSACGHLQRILTERRRQQSQRTTRHTNDVVPTGDEEVEVTYTVHFNEHLGRLRTLVDISKQYLIVFSSYRLR